MTDKAETDFTKLFYTEIGTAVDAILGIVEGVVANLPLEEDAPRMRLAAVAAIRDLRKDVR